MQKLADISSFESLCPGHFNVISDVVTFNTVFPVENEDVFVDNFSMQDAKQKLLQVKKMLDEYQARARTLSNNSKRTLAYMIKALRSHKKDFVFGVVKEAAGNGSAVYMDKMGNQFNVLVDAAKQLNDDTGDMAAEEAQQRGAIVVRKYKNRNVQDRRKEVELAAVRAASELVVLMGQAGMFLTLLGAEVTTDAPGVMNTKSDVIRQAIAMILQCLK